MQAEDLWLRGGFPRSYLAETLDESTAWRRAFIRTFLERDLPQLGINVSTATLRRFWTMLAHAHGQLWNSSEFARSFGLADTTVRGYLDTLSAALVVRQLLPWHENLTKRQVKSPKTFINDSGVLHTLLGLQRGEELESHPKVGASWEGFVIEQLVRHTGARPDECFFWATHAGAELDLLLVRGRQRRGFEIKRSSAPRTTKSMHIALEDLKLTTLDVIHAGDSTFPMTERIRAVSANRLIEDVDPLA
jgi:predicted AAA+ superfamily ATPase